MQLDNPIVLILFVFILFISFCIRKKTIRFLPFILFFAFIPFATAFDIAFILIPILALFINIAHKDKYTINSESLYDVRRIGMAVFAVMLFLTVFTNGQGVGYVLFAVISAISLSREVRHNNNTLNNPMYRLISFLTFTVSSGISFFIVSDFFRSILRNILDRIAYIYFSLVGRLEITYEGEETAEEIIQQELGDGVGSGLYSLIEGEEMVASTATNVIAVISAIWVVLAVIIIFIVLITGVWIARKIFFAYGQVDNDKEIEREFIEVVSTRKKIKDIKRGYSNTIRKYYKRWILFLIKKGLQFDIASTSKDLAEYSFKALKISANDLRKIYIKARYSELDITKQDAQDAKKIYKSLM